jgi:hypothetical protein
MLYRFGARFVFLLLDVPCACAPPSSKKKKRCAILDANAVPDMDYW